MFGDPRYFPELSQLPSAEQKTMLLQCRRLALQQVWRGGHIVAMILLLGLFLAMGLLMSWLLPFTALGLFVAVLWFRHLLSEQIQAQIYIELQVRRTTASANPKKTVGDWLRAMPN